MSFQDLELKMKNYENNEIWTGKLYAIRVHTLRSRENPMIFVTVRHAGERTANSFKCKLEKTMVRIISTVVTVITISLLH